MRVFPATHWHGSKLQSSLEEGKQNKKENWTKLLEQHIQDGRGTQGG